MYRDTDTFTPSETYMMMTERGEDKRTQNGKRNYMIGIFFLYFGYDQWSVVSCVYVCFILFIDPK